MTTETKETMETTEIIETNFKDDPCVAYINVSVELFRMKSPPRHVRLCQLTKSVEVF